MWTNIHNQIYALTQIEAFQTFQKPNFTGEWCDLIIIWYLFQRGDKTAGKFNEILWMISLFSSALGQTHKLQIYVNMQWQSIDTSHALKLSILTKSYFCQVFQEPNLSRNWCDLIQIYSNLKSNLEQWYNICCKKYHCW